MTAQKKRYLLFLLRAPPIDNGSFGLTKIKLQQYLMVLLPQIKPGLLSGLG
jgi:hypothetical protein